MDVQDVQDGQKEQPRRSLLPLVERLGNDVRQTLHQVSGFLDIAAEEPLSLSQSENLWRCRASVDQLLHRVNDLTELVVPEATQFQPKPWRPAEAIQGLVEWMTTLCNRKGLAFHASSGTFPDWIETDMPLVEGILYRILEQRIEATENGGVSLVSSWAEGKIQFDILDTGSVIESDVIADAEGPLDQSQNLGLSLRLVRKRLAEVGGTLTIVSNTTRGASVRVAFPAKAVAIAQEPVSEAGGVKAAPPMHQMSLLVAEDSDESFALFETFVRNEGHRVTRTHNGEEAVQLFRTSQFDLVVMDVQMPVMDGYTATRLIREWETDHGLPRTPIVLLSAEDNNRLHRIGAAVGCSGYLTKPTPKADLLRALRYYGGYRLRESDEAAEACTPVQP